MYFKILKEQLPAYLFKEISCGYCRKLRNVNIILFDAFPDASVSHYSSKKYLYSQRF